MWICVVKRMKLKQNLIDHSSPNWRWILVYSFYGRKEGRKNNKNIKVAIYVSQ